MSGVLSDMLTASLAKHARALTQKIYFNGHPNVVVRGIYPANSVRTGTKGIVIKATRNRGSAVDTHGTRHQWMCVFVNGIDTKTELAINRAPMTFTEIYLGRVIAEDFRKNLRAELGENGNFEG